MLLKDVPIDEDDTYIGGDDDDEDVRSISQQLENTMIPQQKHNDDDEKEAYNDEDDGVADDVESVMSENRGNISDNDLRCRSHNSRQIKPVSVESQPRFGLNFRDVEDTIRPFDGSNNIAVETWIQEFEETAAMLYWDQHQMFIFAKKSL